MQLPEADVSLETTENITMLAKYGVSDSKWDRMRCASNPHNIPQNLRALYHDEVKEVRDAAVCNPNIAEEDVLHYLSNGNFSLEIAIKLANRKFETFEIYERIQRVLDSALGLAQALKLAHGHASEHIAIYLAKSPHWEVRKVLVHQSDSQDALTVLIRDKLESIAAAAIRRSTDSRLLSEIPIRSRAVRDAVVVNENSPQELRLANISKSSLAAKEEVAASSKDEELLEFLGKHKALHSTLVENPRSSWHVLLDILAVTKEPALLGRIAAHVESDGYVKTLVFDKLLKIPGDLADAHAANIVLRSDVLGLETTDTGIHLMFDDDSDTSEDIEEIPVDSSGYYYRTVAIPSLKGKPLTFGALMKITRETSDLEESGFHGDLYDRASNSVKMPQDWGNSTLNLFAKNINHFSFDEMCKIVQTLFSSHNPDRVFVASLIRLEPALASSILRAGNHQQAEKYWLANLALSRVELEQAWLQDVVELGYDDRSLQLQSVACLEHLEDFRKIDWGERVSNGGFPFAVCCESAEDFEDNHHSIFRLENLVDVKIRHSLADEDNDDDDDDDEYLS